MQANLAKAATEFLEGYISHREFVGKLVVIFGDKWHRMPEPATEDDMEVMSIARLLANCDKSATPVA